MSDTPGTLELVPAGPQCKDEVGLITGLEVQYNYPTYDQRDTEPGSSEEDCTYEDFLKQDTLGKVIKQENSEVLSCNNGEGVVAFLGDDERDTAQKEDSTEMVEGGEVEGGEVEKGFKIVVPSVYVLPLSGLNVPVVVDDTFFVDSLILSASEDCDSEGNYCTGSRILPPEEIVPTEVRTPINFTNHIVRDAQGNVFAPAIGCPRTSPSTHPTSIFMSSSDDVIIDNHQYTRVTGAQYISGTSAGTYQTGALVGYTGDLTSGTLTNYPGVTNHWITLDSTSATYTNDQLSGWTVIAGGSITVGDSGYFTVHGGSEESQIWGKTLDFKASAFKHKMRSNLSFSGKSRMLHFEENTPINEQVALETLREEISEAEYRKYLKFGFVLVKGDSGDTYQVFKNKSHTKVWRNGKIVEEICVRIKYTEKVPPTDNVIAFKAMIEANEQEFKKLGNVYRMVA